MVISIYTIDCKILLGRVVNESVFVEKNKPWESAGAGNKPSGFTILWSSVSFLSRHRVCWEEEASLSQVPVSASGEANEENICFQRQRLHAAIRPAGQEERVLVRCATGEVSIAAPPDYPDLYAAQMQILVWWHETFKLLELSLALILEQISKFSCLYSTVPFDVWHITCFLFVMSSVCFTVFSLIHSNIINYSFPVQTNKL